MQTTDHMLDHILDHDFHLPHGTIVYSGIYTTSVAAKNTEYIGKVK